MLRNSYYADFMLDVSTIALSPNLCRHNMSKHNQSFSSTQSNKFYRVFGCLQHLRRHHGHTVKHDASLKKSIEPTPEKELNWNSERCVFRMSKLTFMAYLLSKRGLGTTEPLVRTREPKNVGEVRGLLGLVNVNS